MNAMALASARLAELRDWLVNLVFPPVCSGCGNVDDRFCSDCMRELRATPVVALRENRGALDGWLATGAYSGILASAIRAFKYDGALELESVLAERMLASRDNPRDIVDLLLPVPLASSRFAERGYNQSALLCRHLSDAWRIPWRDDLLWRTRDTEQQTRLRGQQRRDNVRDAFEAAADVSGRSLLLIDDVATTGATLIECGGALKARGASAVYAMTVCQA